MLQWTLGVHVSFSIMVSSAYMPSSGITGSYGSFIPSFLRYVHTVLHSGCINLHFSPTVQKISLFSTPSPAFVVCRLFDDGHSEWCEISHCSFDVRFSNNEQCWASFHVFIRHLKLSVSSFIVMYQCSFLFSHSKERLSLFHQSESVIFSTTTYKFTMFIYFALY